MVGLDTLGGLHLVDELLKILLADFHNDIGEHLDEAAVGVVNKALELRIRVAGDHRGDDIVVQTEVQNGVHHARHGSTRAGADGNEQGVGEIAKLLAVDLLHDLDILHDLGHDLVVDLAAVLIVLGARLGGNGEALGDRKTDSGHLAKVCAFAAEKLTHGSVAFTEQVNVLVAHGKTSYIKFLSFADDFQGRFAFQIIMPEISSALYHCFGQKPIAKTKFLNRFHGLFSSYR